MLGWGGGSTWGGEALVCGGIWGGPLHLVRGFGSAALFWGGCWGGSPS